MAIGTAWADNAWIDESWELNAWYSIITGIIDILEEDDTVALTGYIAQNLTGIITILEDDDVIAAVGNVPVKFVIDILNLNLTIPRADVDLKEQQRILIENFTLIQQALRNLGQ